MLCPPLHRPRSPADKKLRGVISLKGLVLFPDGDERMARSLASRPRPHVFSLHAPTKKFHIQAGDEVEKQAWLVDLAFNVGLLAKTVAHAGAPGGIMVPGSVHGGSRSSSFATAEVGDTGA